jgi:hypothetical protein
MREANRETNQFVAKLKFFGGFSNEITEKRPNVAFFVAILDVFWRFLPQIV